MSVSVRGWVYSSASSYSREQRDVVADVELVDAVLPALVQVHRAGMRDGEHACVVDGADRALLVPVDEPVLDRRSGAQPDVRRGRALAAPVHAPAAGLQQVGVHEVPHGVVEAVAEPALVVGRERQLVRRARDLGAQHERVLRVHDRALGLTVGQLARVRGVPLVELVVAGDEHRRRAAAGASGAAGLLPHRRERAGETVEDHRVEPADVDAELERVRRRDAEQPAAREVAFELAPLLGEVAGAVRGDAGRRAPTPRLRAGPRALRRRARRCGGCA